MSLHTSISRAGHHTGPSLKIAWSYSESSRAPGPITSAKRGSCTTGASTPPTGDGGPGWRTRHGMTSDIAISRPRQGRGELGRHRKSPVRNADLDPSPVAGRRTGRDAQGSDDE